MLLVACIYCQLVRWLLNNDIKYSHLAGKTVHDDEKPQLKGQGLSQNSNRASTEHKSDVYVCYSVHSRLYLLYSSIVNTCAF
jgi:hypothetical protein